MKIEETTDWWREYLNLSRKKNLTKKEQARFHDLLLMEKLEQEND